MVPFEQNGCPKHITMILYGSIYNLTIYLTVLGGRGNKINSVLITFGAHQLYSVGEQATEKKILILKYNYFGFSKGLREQLARVPGT